MTLRRLRALTVLHPWLMRAVWGLAAVLLIGDLWLAGKRAIYARETARLRANMSAVERARLDAALQSDSNRVRVMIELARRQSNVDAELHLAVSTDSGLLHLEQQGAVLRTAQADVGRDAWVPAGRRDSLLVAAPRGARTIAQILNDTTVVLSGGTTIYGGAPDSATRPGSVRISAADFRAIRPNLRAGQRVYFY